MGYMLVILILVCTKFNNEYFLIIIFDCIFLVKIFIIFIVFRVDVQLNIVN